MARLMCRPGRKRLLILLLSTFILTSCAPVPTVKYWDGWFFHLHHPKYTFQIPDGWRPATVSDYPTLGFNRRSFETLDDANRNAALERAQLEMQTRDTGLISPRGAWIQVASASAPGNWYARRDLRFGLSDRQKQEMWQQFSTRLRQSATPTENPNFILESLDFEYYGANRPLRLRFTADEPRGSIHWTVLEFYGSSGVVTVAHMGIPENRDEGIPGLEVLARSFRFM